MDEEGALSHGPRTSVPDTQVIKVCLGAPWLLERWCLMLSERNTATPVRRRSTEAFLYYWSWCQARSCDSGRGRRISACCRSTITQPETDAGGRRITGRDGGMFTAGCCSLGGSFTVLKREGFFYYSTLALSALINN